MNKIQQNILISTGKLYFQFQKQYPDQYSLLFNDIMEVFNCTRAEAETKASTYCNIVSWWLLNFSQSKTGMSFKDFLKKMITTKVLDDNGKEVYCCNDKGFFNAGKNIIAPAIFGYSFNLEYFKDFEDVLNPLARMNPEKGYQLKMDGDTSGDHFIACYIESGKLYGVDTSYRGRPFLLTKYITSKNFQWLLTV